MKSRDWRSEIEKRGGISHGKMRLESGLMNYGKAVSKLGGEMGLRKKREILIRKLNRRLKSGESM